MCGDIYDHFLYSEMQCYHVHPYFCFAILISKVITRVKSNQWVSWLRPTFILMFVKIPLSN